MDFYRVLNWHPGGLTPADNGHPLHIWPQQGKGRVDDPDQDYKVLYVGDSPEGAVAEAFGRYPTWTRAILDPPPNTPRGSRKALVHFQGDPDILDLDDPNHLLRWDLRPSTVITRVRATTQVWARAIYDTHDHAGVSWWSYYEPRWTSIGLWDTKGLTIAERPTVLTINHPIVQDAADIIKRVVSS